MLMMTKTITNDIMLMGVMQWRESYELERHQLSTQSPCQAFFIENLEILWSISVKQKGKAQKYTELLIPIMLRPTFYIFIFQIKI